LVEGDDGRRIAGEGPVGKGVDLDEAKLGHGISFNGPSIRAFARLSPYSG
jgi:hypothetical protein